MTRRPFMSKASKGRPWSIAWMYCHVITRGVTRGGEVTFKGSRSRIQNVGCKDAGGVDVAVLTWLGSPSPFLRPGCWREVGWARGNASWRLGSSTAGWKKTTLRRGKGVGEGDGRHGRPALRPILVY